MRIYIALFVLLGSCAVNRVPIDECSLDSKIIRSVLLLKNKGILELSQDSLSVFLDKEINDATNIPNEIHLAKNKSVYLDKKIDFYPWIRFYNYNESTSSLSFELKNFPAVLYSGTLRFECYKGILLNRKFICISEIE